MIKLAFLDERSFFSGGKIVSFSKNQMAFDCDKDGELGIACELWVWWEE